MKMIFVTIALTALSGLAGARNVTSGLSAFDCFSNNYRHATLKTSADMLEVTDNHWTTTEEDLENLATLIGQEKAKLVSGFRYKGPKVLQSCKSLATDTSIFSCSIQWVNVDLLSKEGSFLETVPNGFIYINSNLEELQASLTIATDVTSSVWKHFKLNSFNLWFNFGVPTNFAACILAP